MESGAAGSFALLLCSLQSEAYVPVKAFYSVEGPRSHLLSLHIWCLGHPLWNELRSVTPQSVYSASPEYLITLWLPSS